MGKKCMLVFGEEIHPPDFFFFFFRANKTISLLSPEPKCFTYFIGKQSVLPKDFFHMKNSSMLTWCSGGHGIPLARGFPASAAQLLTPVQLDGFPIQSKKRNQHFYGKTQLILRWGSDLALGKHLSVGVYMLSRDGTQLPKHGTLPEMQ